jgi:hypothetical protein
MLSSQPQTVYTLNFQNCNHFFCGCDSDTEEDVEKDAPPNGDCGDKSAQVVRCWD